MGLAGFPSTPYRRDLGPRPENRHPVANPKHEVGAELGEFMFHQIVGAGLTADRIVLDVDMATGVINRRLEAWNVDGQTSGDYAPPGITVDSSGPDAGITVTYPASVPDQNGEPRPLLIRGGYVNVLDFSDASAPVPHVWRVLPTDPAGPTCRVVVWQWDAGDWAVVLPRILLVLK